MNGMSVEQMWLVFGIVGFLALLGLYLISLWVGNLLPKKIRGNKVEIHLTKGQMFILSQKIGVVVKGSITTTSKTLDITRTHDAKIVVYKNKDEYSTIRNFQYTTTRKNFDCIWKCNAGSADITFECVEYPILVKRLWAILFTNKPDETIETHM
jgi:hypothetical protein